MLQPSYSYSSCALERDVLLPKLQAENDALLMGGHTYTTTDTEVHLRFQFMASLFLNKNNDFNHILKMIDPFVIDLVPFK